MKEKPTQVMSPRYQDQPLEKDELHSPYDNLAGAYVEKESWEERLDEMWRIHDFQSLKIYAFIKPFINQVLEDYKAELLGKVAEKIHWVDGEELISDHLKGYTAALEDIKTVIYPNHVKDLREKLNEIDLDSPPNNS